MILVAFIIALPISWYATTVWLESFAFRTDFNWPVAAIAGVMLLAIAMLTVSYRSVRAAMASPVEMLRNE